MALQKDFRPQTIELSDRLQAKTSWISFDLMYPQQGGTVELISLSQIAAAGKCTVAHSSMHQTHAEATSGHVQRGSTYHLQLPQHTEACLQLRTVCEGDHWVHPMVLAALAAAASGNPLGLPILPAGARPTSSPPVRLLYRLLLRKALRRCSLQPMPRPLIDGGRDACTHELDLSDTQSTSLRDTSQPLCFS